MEEFNSLFEFIRVSIGREVAVRMIIFFVPATLMFYITTRLLGKQLAKRKIQQKPFKKDRIQHDIIWTIINRVLLSFVTLAITWSIANGKTLIYTDIRQYGIVYLLFSLVLVFLIHDTYFYFFHRLMHHKLLMKRVHKLHHHSNDPTPFTGYAFHPYETIIEFAFLPLIVFVLPLHPIVFALWQFGGIMLFTMYAHLGYELMPRWLVKHPLLKYFNATTHHNMHHSTYNYNYGLYFNVWDRLLGTQHPDYDKVFVEVTTRSQ